MTKLLETAVAAVRRMPADSQDAIAQVMLNLADDAPAEPIDPAHIEAVLEGLAEAERGEFATTEDIAEAFRHFDH